MFNTILIVVYASVVAMEQKALRLCNLSSITFILVLSDQMLNQWPLLGQ